MTGPVKDGQPTGPMTLKALVAFLNTDAAKLAIEPMLPEGQTYPKIVREVLNSTADNPGILDCEIGSIVRAVSRAVSWDLEIGTTAFLVPRKDRRDDAQPKLRAQIGYRGKIELMSMPRGPARMVDAHCIYSNEHYRCEQGTNAFIEHRPIMSPAKRGELVGAYAFAKMTAYDSKIIEMDITEVDAIRQAFSMQWKIKWVQGKQVPLPLSEIPWYLEARCVHRLAKQVPMSGRSRQILSESEGTPEEEDELPTPARRREIGEGAAQLIHTEGGPGLVDTMAPVAGENDHRSPY